MADLIAAIATAPGTGAIGILRLSGEGCARLMDEAFRPMGGGLLSDKEPGKLVLGTLYTPEGAVLDQCLAVLRPGPRSYTGEDTAEIHCHGGPVLLQEGLRSLYARGARPAEPGEFTKRAFLNGRMDLVQAEAVADLIDARTPEAAVQAAGQLGGAMSRRIRRVYDGLTDLLAHFHAVLDYPDEEIEPFELPLLQKALQGYEKELRDLLSTYDRGRLLREGVRSVLLGKPNAGKSSLLNALAGYERAIVTAIPGTTRDTVEARIRRRGLLIDLVDTAGIRPTEDPVEKLGVDRAMEAAGGAELVLAVFDGSRPWEPEDEAVLAAARKAERTLLLINKSDRPRLLRHPALEGAICVSALTGEGLELLLDRLDALFPQGSGGAAGEMLTNARQAENARRALLALSEAEEALSAGFTPDAVLVGVEDAMKALGELTGIQVGEDVTARIFQRFCVGK